MSLISATIVNKDGQIMDHHMIEDTEKAVGAFFTQVRLSMGSTKGLVFVYQGEYDATKILETTYPTSVEKEVGITRVLTGYYWKEEKDYV